MSAQATLGLAAIESCSSRFQAANLLATRAYQLAPDDPAQILSWGKILEGAGRLSALEKVLSLYGPETEEARSLRASIAAERTLGGRGIRTLESGYRHYDLKLMRSSNGSRRPGRFTVQVLLNGSISVTLSLDTGASGILLNRKPGGRAALEALEHEGVHLKGRGDETAPRQYHHLARELRIGDLAFSNYPVAIANSDPVGEVDGLVGTDVFEQFLVNLDFRNRKIILDPYPGLQTAPVPRSSDAARPVPQGSTTARRVGHHLLIPTKVNGSAPLWFMIDSGASGNRIDLRVARERSIVRPDPSTVLRGVQGRVNNVSRANSIDFEFAGLRQRDSDVICIDLGRESDDVGVEMSGVIGRTVLENLKVLIDYRNGGVAFKYKE